MYKIKSLEKWKEDDSKKVYKFSADTNNWILIELNKGATAGGHYHKGIVKSKDPEINVIIKGKAKYKLQNTKTDEEKEIIVEAQSIIEIQPYVKHTIEALEDFTFIEPFDEEAVKKDRFE
ncbi:MAG: glucose-6-phosphate isomerase family protein [Candidatus Woesearchaeota archaeon]